MQNWPVWAVLLVLVGLPAYRMAVAFAQWVVAFSAGRQDVRATRAETALQQFEAARAALMSALEDQLKSAQGTMQGYEQELSKLRRARGLLQEHMIEVRTAALAARAMVHELERRMGEPQTLFTPLPPLEDA